MSFNPDGFTIHVIFLCSVIHSVFVIKFYIVNWVNINSFVVETQYNISISLRIAFIVNFNKFAVFTLKLWNSFKRFILCGSTYYVLYYMLEHKFTYLTVRLLAKLNLYIFKDWQVFVKCNIFSTKFVNNQRNYKLIIIIFFLVKLYVPVFLVYVVIFYFSTLFILRLKFSKFHLVPFVYLFVSHLTLQLSLSLFFWSII